MVDQLTQMMLQFAIDMLLYAGVVMVFFNSQDTLTWNLNMSRLHQHHLLH